MANAGTEHPTPEAAAPVPAAGAPTACDHLIYPLCGCAAAPAVADAVPEATPEAAPPAKPPRKPPSRRKSGTSIPWAKDAQEEQARKKREAEQLRERVLAMMQDPKQYPALEKQINAERARRSFAEFFRQSWKEFDPNTDLVWNWHLGLMCCVLQALFFDWLKTKRVKGYINKCRHVIFSVPPGSSKSAVISRAFQAFCWLHFPGMKFICLSVNEEAALRDAVATRDLVSSPWYRGQFGTTFTIKGDQDAKGNFANTVGGSRISRPIKAETVGLRADCVSGDTLVTTEWGDVSIATLHTMPAGTWPRVWSVDLLGNLGLHRIKATRCIEAQRTIEIEASATKLQCTPDHRVMVDGCEYVAAKDAVGRGLTLFPLALTQDTCRGWGAAGYADVYDIEVDVNHNFFANGILVHNCVSLDDPNNPKKSESKTERDEVNALWDTNHYNRVNNLECSLRIGVQQRTNADDWTGHVLKLQGTWKPEKRNGWLHVVLPAEYDPTRKFVLPPELVELLEEQVRLGNLRQEDLILADPRTIPGETLDKQRLPPDVLESERERWAGTGNYAGQMNQQPAATEGAIIKRDYWSWFRLEGGVRADVDDLITNRPRPDGCTPRDKQAAELVKAKLHAPGTWDFDWVTMSIDPALKKTDRGSNWGLGMFGGKGIRRYWLDDRSQRGDILTILEAIKDMVRLWRPTKILLEDKAASAEVHREIMNAIAAGGMPMVEIVLVKVGNQGKEQRLDTALPTLANGLVALLDGATWLEAVVEETAWFPRGMNDDRVDYMSQLINHYATIDAAGGTWVGF